MEFVVEALSARPLNPEERVLGLTFMHGARLRLATRLGGVAQLRNRFECVTIDSFAWRLLNRWRALAARMHGPTPDTFDGRCDLAGALLERPEVCAWVTARFPIVVIDEAQDLQVERLRIARALAERATLLLAADEFQCLDQTLRPNPLVVWLRNTSEPEVLTTVHRTNVQGLLLCAARIRAAQPWTANRSLKLLASKGIPMGATFLANAIAWNAAGTVAVITPSFQGGFANAVVERVRAHSCGKSRNGPYAIYWEQSEQDQHSQVVAGLNLPERCSTAEAAVALRQLPQGGLARRLVSRVTYEARVGGRTEFTAAELSELVGRELLLRRRHTGAGLHPLRVMTVQQAKNREFDGVVVLWPYQVGGDDEHRRRLLYNAVTRAQRWCTIVLQGQEILNNAPFR
jgi:hypothetical protein